MSQAVAKDDLLFHAVHGLCRVSAVQKSVSGREPEYTLLPVSLNNGNIRFVVPENALEESGFARLVSSREAQAILKYFRTGKKKDPVRGPAWNLATLIRSESRVKDAVKDGRRRQKVDHAVRGLVGQLAFVLRTSSKEMADMIQKHLGPVSKTNPSVRTALTSVDKS